MKLSKWLFAALATALTIGALSVNSMAQVLVPGNGSGNVNVAAGKSLTVNNTLTLSGTDNTTQTFPATSDTMAGLATSQTFTGTETFGNTTTFSSAATFNNTATLNSAVTAANTITFTSSPTFTSGPNSIDTHYGLFGNSLLANPLTQTVFTSFLTASANNGVNVLNSTASRQIFPGAGLSIMVSGTAAGATSLNLECQPSHGIIATWPIAELVDHVPVGIYASSVTVLSSGLNQGCPAANSVQLSANGTLSTTTWVGVNLPYVVQ